MPYLEILVLPVRHPRASSLRALRYHNQQLNLPSLLAQALMTSKPRTFKILLLGDVSVGKTALLRQFSYGEFSPGQASTLWYDVEFKEMVIQNHRVRLALWVRSLFPTQDSSIIPGSNPLKDTGGQEKFKSLPPAIFHKARAVILGV